MLSRARRGVCEIALWRCRCEIVAGAAMPLPKSWQAQHSVHLGVCLCGRGRIRQLSRGTGCCRARGGGCAKSWQAQHFGDAVAKLWQAQHFGDAVAEVVAGAAFCASGCVFVWQGGTGCCRARGGGCAKSWQAQHFGDAVAKSWQAQHFGDAVAEVVAGAACIWECVCVAGVAFGSCLEGQDVVARAAGGVRNRGRRSTLAMPLRNRGRRSTLRMPLPKSWQAQHSVHLGVCLCGRGRIRQLSRGTGCCRARGGGCAKSWQAQHFGDAVAKSWQAQHFGDAVAEVVAGAAFCASGCVFVWQGSHSAAV